MSQDAMVERYGAPARWRRPTWIAVGGLIVVSFSVWLVWSVYTHSTPDVASQLETFTITSDHDVSATVLIRLKNPDIHATCILEAQSDDHTVVGNLAFTPPAQRNSRLIETVKTERPATSVDFMGCTAPGQLQPQ